ncbi:hypothetical protein E4U51_007844 [Claviceps purpurea]|nr:hypothetical protein E4U51_007844 [Claviceps purpurea]
MWRKQVTARIRSSSLLIKVQNLDPLERVRLPTHQTTSRFDPTAKHPLSRTGDFIPDAYTLRNHGSWPRANVKHVFACAPPPDLGTLDALCSPDEILYQMVISSPTALVDHR